MSSFVFCFYSLVVILEPHLGRFPGVLVLEARGDPGSRIWRWGGIFHFAKGYLFFPIHLSVEMKNER
jgi:hypothetical protein